MIREVLEGKEHPAMSAVVLNAAAALVVARNLAPEQATASARESIQTGRAAQALAQLVTLSNALPEAASNR